MLHEKHFSGVKRKIERNSIVKRHIRAAVLGHVPEQRALACLPHAGHGNDLEAAACTLDERARAFDRCRSCPASLH